MNDKLKPKMTYEEMAEAFVQDNPYFVPNYTNVGRYARKMGYNKTSQMINRVNYVFYLKID